MGVHTVRLESVLSLPSLVLILSARFPHVIAAYHRLSLLQISSRAALC